MDEAVLKMACIAVVLHPTFASRCCKRPVQHPGEER